MEINVTVKTVLHSTSRIEFDSRLERHSLSPIRPEIHLQRRLEVCENPQRNSYERDASKAPSNVSHSISRKVLRPTLPTQTRQHSSPLIHLKIPSKVSQPINQPSNEPNVPMGGKKGKGNFYFR